MCERAHAIWLSQRRSRPNKKIGTGSLINKFLVSYSVAVFPPYSPVCYHVIAVCTRLIFRSSERITANNFLSANFGISFLNHSQSALSSTVLRTWRISVDHCLLYYSRWSSWWWLQHPPLTVRKENANKRYTVVFFILRIVDYFARDRNANPLDAPFFYYSCEFGRSCASVRPSVRPVLMLENKFEMIHQRPGGWSFFFFATGFLL